MRSALAVLVASATALALAPGASAQTGDLRIGVSQNFETPNPFKAIEAISVEAYTTLYYDQLIGLKTSDQSQDYRASLATGADVSADGRTVTFHLRKGIRWSDGKPFTSADVRWTFDAVRKNATNQLHGGLDGVTSIATPDPLTVVLRRTTRDSEFLDKLAIPILPAHIWSRFPLAKLDKIDGPIPTVTTAPYMLTTWNKTGTTILTRNPRYDLARNGRREPAVKRVLITAYQNQDSVYRDIVQGNLDYAVNGEPQWARRVRGKKDLRLISSPRGGYWEIAFNSCPPAGSPTCSGPGKGVKVAVVQDPAIRRALAYGIDRARFIPTVYDGQGTTAYGLISPRFRQYFVDRSKDPRLAYVHSVAKARAELKAGGWDCATTPCTKNGVKARFELLTLSSNKPFQRMAQRVVADARKVGIVIDVSFLQDDALNNRIYASGKIKDTYAPSYDAFLWDWDVSGTTPTPIFEVLRSSDPSSDSFYTSKAFDADLQHAREASTKAATVAAVQAADAQVLRDLPYLPLVHLNSVEIARTDTWHGWVPSPSPKGRLLDEAQQQVLALQPGPAPAAAATNGTTTPIAHAASSGWLTTPRAVLLGFGLLSAAILASTLISGRRRHLEPLEWTDE